MIYRNLNAINSTVYSVFREPSKELAEPLGSAEPRLKNIEILMKIEATVLNTQMATVNHSLYQLILSCHLDSSAS